MKLEGRLKLKYNNIDYTMFYKGRNINISEVLNVQLMNDVYVRVEDTYTNEILFEEKGQLIKNRIDKGFYLYYINGQDLDSVLWDNVGQRLCIEIKNVSSK